MKLISLELKNYTRLYVSGIKHIIYTPENSFNIILGRNGSGKSSLVKEIFPNVDELKNDYDKGGYKILTLKHKDKTFTIIYKRDGNSHSFLIDGEEQNPQHIQKTQRILIEQYFGLTKPIYEMMLSSLNFTSMSVSERKRWFTNILTTVDYDYALNLYNKTKVRIKELTSFMKLIQSKLMKNADLIKELNPDYIALLKDDKIMLHKMLDALLENKTNKLLPNKPDIELITKLTDILDKHLDKIVIGNDESYYNSKILYLKEQQKDLKNKNETIGDKLRKIDGLKIDTGVSLKDLEDNKVKIENKINSLIKQYDVGHIDTLYSSITSFNNNYNTLLALAENIASMGDIRIITNDDRNKAVLLENKIKELSESIIELDKVFNLQRSYKEQPEVSCPKCSNIFKPNFDNDKYLDYKDRLNKTIEEKNKIVNEYEEITNDISKFNTLTSHIEEFKMVISSCCPIIYTMVLKDTDDLKNIKNIVNVISTIKVTLPDSVLIDELKDELKDIESRILLYKRLSKEKLDDIANKKLELSKERVGNIDRINAITTELTVLSNDLKRLQGVKQIFNKLSYLIREVNNYKKDVIEVEYNTYLNNLILDVKKEVTEIETKLIEYDRLKSNNDELEKELKVYESKLKSVKELEVMLSPNKGLIGESINTTMNVILDRMNEIINKVWSYEIDILPCDISENDLTFRFPVKINGVKDIPDISKGSSSIKDIIDLSFKITAMEFLGMLDYPLILDELGSTFSVSHRVSVYDFIDELSKGYFNQVFMISHFEDMFGRFKNTDIVLLDNEGINFTGTFNKVIDIRR